MATPAMLRFRILNIEKEKPKPKVNTKN